ncbi:MAG: hypothetical protein K6T90_02895 [Leptolyngbyaceae cyanobacterium HOT.MB2.61]|nr:hypothetical protein [Leptolyngbyaceae cyanobacterium HOT.MB2.61]
MLNHPNEDAAIAHSPPPIIGSDMMAMDPPYQAGFVKPDVFNLKSFP